MSEADIAEILGYLLASWVLGFCGGYLFTVFRRAMDAIN